MNASNIIGLRRPILLLAVAALAIGCISSSSSALAETFATCPSPEVEARIDELIAKMTLDEKLGQLTQRTGPGPDYNPAAPNQENHDLLGSLRAGKIGSFLNVNGAENVNQLQHIAVDETRMGIPIIFANDVIHGYRTIFPIPLGEAASWDLEMIEMAARVAATEAAAAGTQWTLAPMVDVCRDARWGRVAEGAGEDPYLGSAVAIARVRGFQGTDLSAPDTVIACAKHFAAYGGAEGGRDYNTVDICEQTLREVYLPPFRAAVDAGVGTLMSSFNEINGVPASANPLTLDRILRQEWGFKGFVVSDWTSVTEMVAHAFAADDADAALKALTAGVDMDMSSFSYRSHLGEAVETGLLNEAVIDRAVRRVLRAKFAVGLFDRPYADPELERKVTLCDRHRQIARDVARHSMVLIRNEKKTLPLADNVKSIAVIGPLANNQFDPLGTWSIVGREEDVKPVLTGVEERAGQGVQVRYAKGCEIEGGDDSGFAEAVALAKDSDVAILVIGEGKEMSGEAHSRSTLDLPGRQRELAQAVQATGTPTIVVLMNGRAMSIPWLAENVDAILVIWHPGIECGPAVADVLFGDFNPGGKLPVTFPRTVGQSPLYYNHKNTGRPPTKERYTSKYIDVPSTPLYPFGYGLSYTKFKFSNLTISDDRIGPHGNLEITADITNTGDRIGDEVAQLYIRDLVASRTRPVKELKGFARVTLEPGQTKQVTFRLGPQHLGFYDTHMEYVVEPGTFNVWVGPNSVSGLQGQFEVVEIDEE